MLEQRNNNWFFFRMARDCGPSTRWASTAWVGLSRKTPTGPRDYISRKRPPAKCSLVVHLPTSTYSTLGFRCSCNDWRNSILLGRVILPAPVVGRGGWSGEHDATGSKKPIPFNQLPFLLRQLLSADLNLFKEPRVTGHLTGLLTATWKWCHYETLGPSIVAFEFVGFDLRRGARRATPTSLRRQRYKPFYASQALGNWRQVHSQFPSPPFSCGLFSFHFFLPFYSARRQWWNSPRGYQSGCQRESYPVPRPAPRRTVCTFVSATGPSITGGLPFTVVKEQPSCGSPEPKMIMT